VKCTPISRLGSRGTFRVQPKRWYSIKQRFSNSFGLDANRMPLPDRVIACLSGQAQTLGTSPQRGVGVMSETQEFQLLRLTVKQEFVPILCLEFAGETPRPLDIHKEDSMQNGCLIRGSEVWEFRLTSRREPV
jgi:hypothetical protein